ncbi:MAG: toxin, partial [Comamonadaceae bacterium]
MSADTLLAEPIHSHIFKESVVPWSAFNDATPRQRPRAIITAGQPGAGKGGLVRAATTELRQNVVTIDPDELRKFVPGVDSMKGARPLTWSGESHPAAKAYADGLRDLAIEGRRNLIIDTTLAGADPVIDQIRTMQAKGYEVEVRVVAAHRLESELGIDKRYARSLVEDGSGRHVPGDFHDYAYRNLPGNLDKVHEQTGARIRIYNREGVELYDSRTSPLKPGVALAQAREARLHDPKVTRTTAEVGREQQDFHRKLPETLERNPRISRETAKNLPPERAALDVVTRIEHAAGEASAVDFGTRIKPAVHAGLKVAAGAAVGLDTVVTGRETARLLDQDNRTGAQSQILHFGARNLGMAGGAALGSSAGVPLGAPGMVIGGIAGGVGGAVAGEKMADAVDRARIYSQR